MRPANMERAKRIYDAYIDGKPQWRIAEEEGICQQRVSQIIKEFRELVGAPTPQEVAQLAFARFDEAIAAIMPRVREGDKDAIQSLISIEHRKAKMLGLDAAQRVEHSGKIATYEIVGLDPDDLT